jgi:hypothetical protein
VNSKGYVLNQAEATESLDRNTLWVRELHLKKGAMVMLVTVSFLLKSVVKLTNPEHAGKLARDETVR